MRRVKRYWPKVLETYECGFEYKIKDWEFVKMSQVKLARSMTDFYLQAKIKEASIVERTHDSEEEAEEQEESEEQ